MPGLSAVPSIWGSGLVDDSTSFRRAFLRNTARLVESYPCPSHCGCFHRVIRHEDGSVLAVCQCDPCKCRNIDLTLADITALELNLPQFGAALCKAFGLERKFVDLALPCTTQIGSWSSTPVPVILTIQWEDGQLPLIIAELALRLKVPFILFAPTSAHVDAHCQELLTDAGAAFFALDAHVLVTDHGTLQARTLPGELFSRLMPVAQEAVGHDVARRAFTLIDQLDSDSLPKPPTVITVFRLYCIRELSSEQVANRCHCCKTSVIRRLKIIRAKTGMNPRDLRRFSSHLSKIDAELSDARATRIDRNPMANGDDE